MILFIWSQLGAVCPIMKITKTDMLKPCNQMNFIIINLTESKSCDLNKWSFNKNIFKCIAENSHLYFDQTCTVYMWWNKPPEFIKNLLNKFPIERS